MCRDPFGPHYLSVRPRRGFLRSRPGPCSRRELRMIPDSLLHRNFREPWATIRRVVVGWTPYLSLAAIRCRVGPRARNRRRVDSPPVHDRRRFFIPTCRPSATSHKAGGVIFPTESTALVSRGLAAGAACFILGTGKVHWPEQSRRSFGFVFSSPTVIRKAGDVLGSFFQVIQLFVRLGGFLLKLWGRLSTCGGVVYPACLREGKLTRLPLAF